MNKNVMFFHGSFYRTLVTRLAVKQMRVKKLLAILLASVALAAIFALSPVISSLMNPVVIRSTGRIASAAIYADSGSAEDIQTAVDEIAAAGGGNVYVPEGDWAFDIQQPENYGVHIPGGVNVIGAGKDKTILRMTAETAPDTTGKDFATMFDVSGENGLSVRISNIKFTGYVDYSKPGGDSNTGQAEWGATVGIAVSESVDFRIDHCSFQDFTSASITTYMSKGVIDHCDITNPYKYLLSPKGSGGWAYGIIVIGQWSTWVPDIDDILGKYDEVQYVTYIEDCTFRDCRHSTAATGGGHYVLRYCDLRALTGGSDTHIDAHGGEQGGQVGTRCVEAYENTLVGNDYPVGWDDAEFAIGIRGGGGVIFNNIINDLDSFGYIGEEGIAQTVGDLYIWGNMFLSMTSGEQELIIHRASLQENVDYFFHAKPGYTPYPYPHPLTLVE